MISATKASNFIVFMILVLPAYLMHGNSALAKSGIVSDTIAVRYSQNNKYIPDAFPAKLISDDFSIKVSPEELVVVYPSAAEQEAIVWQRSLDAHLGVRISFFAADKIGVDEFKNHHLIILGNINDNPWVLELYKQRYAFADAYFPGAGGFIINPSTSVWNRNRNVLIIGASRTQDLDEAFKAFLEQLEPQARSISAIRVLKTDSDFGEPVSDIQPVLNDVLANMQTKMAPYSTIANWGLSYHLSGNKQWAAHFRDAMYMLHSRAVKSGAWITEPWTNVYFYFSNMILVWDLIDDDPFFTREDRKTIEEVLWGYTTFIRWLPNLDPNQAPPGEMRQNHTTFLALSLYFAHRYYSQKYDLGEELSSMMDKVHRAFDDGQANSFIPNDDAGGYIQYAPLHTMTYMLAEGNMDYVQSGRLARTSALIAATFDNRKDEVSFGDVGSYRHADPGSIRGGGLKFFGMSAYFDDHKGHQWIYNWLGSSGRFNFNNLYIGEYATEKESAVPLEYTGVHVVALDKAARAWFGRRSRTNARLPKVSDNYFHKVAFRRSFDPEDEYLLLDGLSGLSHGHHDGNSILRLTWKDRIWLFDLDYIKFSSKYHNGVTVVKEGVQEDPPPLTRLDLAADGPMFGLTRSTAQNYSGADWERTILWRKGSWFFTIDRIKARKDGDYRITGRWRMRGDVSLDKGNLRSVQGDKSFYIKSADTAPRRIEFEPDGALSKWGAYPWGKGGLEVLITRKELSLTAGQDVIFANLMSASDNTYDPGYEVLNVSDNLYRISDARSSLLVGLESSWLERFGVLTNASLFLINADELHLFNVSHLRIGQTLIAGLPSHVVFRPGSGLLQDINGKTIQQMDSPVSKLLGQLVSDALSFTFGPAYHGQVDNKKALEDFGLEPYKPVKLDTVITARADESDKDLILGDARGRILIFNSGSSGQVINTPAGSSISAIASGDLDGDGIPEIVAGDVGENLYCYTINGDLLWQKKLTRFNGPDAYARDITIGNIDDSGKPVILVGTGGWKLYAIGSTGYIHWESFIFYHPLTKVGVIDTGAGKRYVVAGTEYQTPFNIIDPKTGIVIYYAWEEMGSEFIASTDYFGIHLTGMTSFDANNDGAKDLIFGTLSNYVYAVNVADGKKIWESNAGGEVTVIRQFMDSETGEVRLLIANDAGDLILFDGSGKRLCLVSLGSRITAVRTLPVVQQRVDIVVSTFDGDLIVLDEALQIRAAHSFGKLLQSVGLIGDEGRKQQLMIIGKDFVQQVDYEPFYLKRSTAY